MTHDEQAQIDNWFEAHRFDEVQAESARAIRSMGARLATVIMETCPPSADRTAALRKVREAVMTANASIACGGK